MHSVRQGGPVAFWDCHVLPQKLSDRTRGAMKGRHKSEEEKEEVRGQQWIIVSQPRAVQEEAESVHMMAWTELSSDEGAADRQLSDARAGGLEQQPAGCAWIIPEQGAPSRALSPVTTASSQMVAQGTIRDSYFPDSNGGEVFGQSQRRGKGFRVRPLNPLFVRGFHHGHALASFVSFLPT